MVDGVCTLKGGFLPHVLHCCSAGKHGTVFMQIESSGFTARVMTYCKGVLYTKSGN